MERCVFQTPETHGLKIK